MAKKKGRYSHYRRLSGFELNQKYCTKKGKVNRFIDGVYRDTSKIVAYCWNVNHRGYLTKKMMEGHDCIKKECSFLQLYNK